MMVVVVFFFTGDPVIDYGPDCDRATPFYDATLVLGLRVREPLTHEGV